MSLMTELNMVERTDKTVVEVEFLKRAEEEEKYSEVGYELFKKVRGLIHRLKEICLNTGIEITIVNPCYEPITAFNKHYAGFTMIFPKKRQEELIQAMMKETCSLGLKLSTFLTTKIEE